ncbi:MAG: HAD family hydrolase [Patescibacteria group bacterium]
MKRSRIACIIFDLDRCIFDTSSMGPEVLEPIRKVIRESNLSDTCKTQAQDLLLTTSLTDLACACEIPESVVSQMRAAYRSMTVPAQARSYGDEQVIAQLPGEKILVTTGFERFQREKIAHTGVTRLFSMIVIDAVDDVSIRKGKEKIFSNLAHERALPMEAICVVGDSPDSELGAGKRLGMVTVQTLRPGVVPWDGADYRIQNLRELTTIIEGA